MRKITLLSFLVLFSAFGFGQTPCSPISPLDCGDVIVPLPVDLDFNSGLPNTVLDQNSLGTGFTAILENSEPRRAGDIAISDPNLNGYEPSLLTLNAGNLEILSQGGIAYLDPPASNNNNNQINTLGVGFDDLNETITIRTRLVNIVTGGSSAQAGIWYGYDEDNFVKLNVNDNNIELRVESNGLSANGPDQIQLNLGASGNDVTLEMVIDPGALTAEAFYTIGSGTRTSMGSLAVPGSYFTGRDINPTGGQDNISFAGIYATHRAGSQFTATFGEFSVETPAVPLSTETEILSFTLAEQTGVATIGSGTIGIEVANGTDLSALTPTITLSNGATVDPASGVGTDFTGGPVTYTVTAEDGTTTQDWAVSVTAQEVASSFAYIEDFDTYGTGNLHEISGGAWEREDTGETPIPVIDEGLTPNTTHVLDIDGFTTVHDYRTLIDNPENLIPNVPFYFGTYFQVSELGTNEADRIRVAIRVDDDNPGDQWVRQRIGRYGGAFKASLGLGGSSSDDGQSDVYPDQLVQFVVKGVWDGSSTISYSYTISPELSEGDNVWVDANSSHTVSGTPSLGRIFISNTSTGNSGRLGPIRLATEYTDVVDESINSPANATFTVSVNDLSIDLDASDSIDDGSIASFSWNFGNGDSDTGETVSYTYPTAGTYDVVLTVTDNDGLTATATQEVTVQAPFVASFPYQINFQDEATIPPTGYLTDFGLPYGSKDGGLTYGWIKLSDGQPIDLSTPSNGVGRNRGEYPQLDLLQETLVHMQGNDVGSWSGNRSNEGVWEIQVPNGWYEVSVSAGDANQDGSVTETPNHFVRVEGVTAIPLYDVDSDLPNGDPARFVSGTAIVEVLDGKLTIDADNPDANNTKINFAVIAETTEPPSTETLVINEIMFDPDAVADTAGEWFELFNPGSEAIDINGWTIKDDDTDDHIISNGGPLLVPAGGYLVLGNNSNASENGGKIVDYQYSGITLANTVDEVVLIDAADNEIDRVAYDDGATFPNPVGASIALNNPTDENNLGGSWSTATVAFGTGDLGTPGVSNAGKANESPAITSADAVEVEENQTAIVDVEASDDNDSEGSGIAYGFGGGVDDALFAIDPATGVVTFQTAPDFETPADDGADNIYNVQIVVTDSGSLTGVQNLTVTVTDLDESLAFEAHVNFSDKGRVPPAGYAVDYGKDFGFSTLTSGTEEYDYGWKLLETGLPFDASNDAPSNSSGVGRNRIGTSYDTATDQEKLEGTLVHYQGDNIAGWGDGQPRKNELFWELEIPNGTYEVTLGLGDKMTGNIDSRHSATLEGYTIIPAFNPVDQEVRTASMIVEVTDGFLTLNGLGGFNSKITHIDVVESTGTPVNGVLVFDPATVSESLEAGSSGVFSSSLSGDGASDIGLVIDDNVDETGSNDWLTLPTTDVLGNFDFAMDATLLSEGDTRANTIIATAKGFTPAVLAADLTVTAPVLVEISVPFRMNVAGNDYTRDGDIYIAETPDYLEEQEPTTVSSTAYTPYTVPGGHQDLYFPRRFGEAFSYNFPIADGEYTVSIHMVENFQTTAGVRIFDVTIEDEVLIDDLDLFATYGKGALALLSFDITVDDGELNLDFVASENNAIVQAIEIVPVPSSQETDILTFALAEQTEAAIINAENHTVDLEVANGTDLTTLAPTVTFSNGASVSPASGETTDFSNGSVTYTVTAEDDTVTQDWAVMVTEADVVGGTPCNPLSNLPCDQIETALPLSLDFTAANGNLSESGLTMVLEPSARLTSDDGIADANVPGYAPSRVVQDATGLTITSTKGIFYSQLSSQGNPNSTDTNSQMNALGVGVVTPSNVFSITSTLESPDFSVSTGNNSQQAGIWFGLDEDHYIKLAVIKTGNSSGKVQLQVENMDENSSATAYLELDSEDIPTGAGDITLRLELDPVNNTVQGYYTLGGGSEILISEGGADSFPVPASYFAGTSYDTANPSEVLNFAGIFTTHRRAGVDQPITVLFKQFDIVEEQQPLALTFDVDELNFSGTLGETIPPRTVTVSASSGTPTYVLSDDPDASEWLILPIDPVLGEIEFGIEPDLPVGSYSTTIFASDQPDLGYANAEMTISLEITEAVNDFTVNINFSDAVTPAPVDYERDSGLPYGDRGNGLNYGWLQTDGTTPLDLSPNARNRDYPALDIKQRTLIHMQYGDVGGSNGVLTEGIWEIEVPNGTYNVSVAVGDPDVDGQGTTPTHRINAEGVNLIDNFGPTGTAGSATRFSSGSRTVNVSDGRLTIEADAANGGFNTKINSIEITATEAGVQTPRVVAVTPVDGATNVSVTPTISANDLFLPNFDTDGNSGVDNTTITNNTVRLLKQGNTTPVGATVNGTGGGDAINLVPNLPLETNTTYVLEIDGVLDLVGEPFEFFTSSFTTGDGNTGPTTDLDNVTFTKSGAVASGSKYSTLTIGPDGKLYGLVISGDIHRWTINADGTLANQETLSAWKSTYGSRTSVGMVFDPAATSGNLIAYVSHNSGGLSGAPDWDGKISRLTGADLQTEELLVTDLPRSTKDHLTNSLTFRPGEPNALYFNQGSNSAAGAPDGSWGNREESLLTAATLRLDLSLLPSALPLDVRTTRDQSAIDNVDVNSPTLDGLYNPYYVNAPLTLFATGIRNAYDLVWHSNGQLYVPTNGTAGGSNAPASIDGTRRPDGAFYDHANPLYPVVPASNGNNTQRDWLFRIDPNTGIGYYGHPNPFRGEFVLNRGDIDVNNSVYNGVEPDENYRGAAFDFELNKSPNGVIEYQSDAENGNLKGALLVVRYSGGSDIIALVPDGPNGDIATFKEGIPGFTSFQDPLDLIEDVNTGNIYVSDYGRSEIVLLKPSNQAAPTPRIVVNLEEITGDAVTNTDTFTQEVLLSNLGNAVLADIQAQLTGANADQFTIVGLPSSVNSQNSASFTVDFTPTSNGPKFAELVLSGTGADAVTIPLRGLGKTGLGGSSEPSLQWILDTQLGDGVVNVGDTNPATNVINLPNGSTYNDILGDEVSIQKFERAVDAPVTLELLSVYGPTANNPVVAFGWYNSGNAASTNELFTVTNSPVSNGQTLNAPVTGATEFDPGTQSFGFYSRWPFFDNRQLFSEDELNTFASAIPHHVRVYELPGEDDAYIIATEEHISGFDYQDIVVIARNIRPVDDTPPVACSPISTLDCDELEVALPFSLDFDGTEGGLSNTGFTMVDDPSARIAADGPTFDPNVPGYEPSKLSLSNGNLIINANNGIAYRTNGTGSDQSTDVNSQINTLGVGIDAGSYGNFSIETSIVNPYTDASNNSEQAGIWFGLDEDNFVKYVANVSGGLELRREVNGISENNTTDQLSLAVAGLNSSTVRLRLYIDVGANTMTAFYTLNNGAEVEVGSMPLPATYISGNADYDNLSFAGIFATKRRELTADVNYTFEDFAITSDNVVTFEPVKINFSLPDDVPPADYLVDSGLGYADRGNGYSYGWLTVDGTNPLDLSVRARNRGVNGVGILQNTLVHMQFQNVDPAGQEGIWEIEVPNGTYNVSVGVGDPNLDGQAGTEPFHTINVEGVNAVDRYSPTGVAGAATRFTSGTATATVTDGRLTIDASGGFNTKINSLEITQGGAITQPFFANVNPADNATDVRIEDFQINVEVVVPNDYEIDISTLAGNINLFEVTAAGDVLVPSNSNDTGGGDAITLTPIPDLKEFTTYRFVLTSDIEANRRGDLNDRLSFLAFESTFTTGEIDDDNTPIRDLTGVEFTQVSGVANLGPGVDNQRFSSLVIGPDGKLYGSTIGNFNSDGQIFRWDMAADGTLTNLEILTPALQGSPHPETNATGNDDRLIIGLAFDPASTADNLIAYVTHSKASITGGPEWDGKLTRLSGPTLSTVQDVLIHLPRSVNDHLTNSVIFDAQGDMYINQGSNSAGGEPDGNWGFRPERLLAAAVLKLELDKLPSTLPLSVFTTDDISVINSAPSGSLQMSDGTYNPYASNSPLTVYASGVRNAYDLVWHSNGWLYVPTNGTAGNNNSSPNSPATADYTLARRIDGLTTIPSAPALNGGETQKDWLFKTQGGSYHGHPNPYRGEFVLNHGGISYSGLPGQVEASYTDVNKYPDNLGPDPNYREPAFDFGKNKSPNGAIEYKSDAFGGKLQGLLMVVRFSGQDDLLVLDPKTNGDIAEAYNSIPGLSGFDDPLDVVEDPNTGNIYISEYDRDNNGTARLTLLRAAIPATTGPKIAATPDELIFEITVNNDGNQTDTQTVEVTNDGNEILNISSASITGSFADQFDAVQPSGAVTVNPGESQTYTVTYAPDLDGSDLGYQEASLTIESDVTDNPSFSVGLHALKKAGFEGGEEPALQDVVDALGIGIDVGWTSLSSSTSAAPVGDEAEVERWVKASDAPINVTPVGRYSPAEELPFGWYTNDGSIATNEVGVLADGIDQAQTLFPEIASGESSFDPAGAVFGFYVESQSFGRFNYSEDAINTGGVAHRTRIYPMADREGNPIENSYLITFEDASNGDYQDYMFIIDNVIPYESGLLALDFDKGDVGFIASINQEDIPVQQVTLSGNGGITSAGIELEASEDWLVLPDNFELGVAFDLGVDTSGLSIGSYQATVTASAPNYEEAIVNVSLDITNELVYTYQFNFQTPDDIETSPEGYIDDIGAPYGEQSTILGDLTYGWVLPGTLTPADAGVNGRNRDSGVQDGVLLQTFTIIGHPTPATYPLRDWVVNVPNGTYSVNISVGERDFSNSNHILDVNGTTVVSFDQENNNPDNLVYFEDTKFVDVTDGLLRLSLDPQGNNAKPNYIRLAPIDNSLLPPTILATFEGNESAPDTYRGTVDITLEATDNSESGGIARFEYVLDGNPVASYSQPISVGDEGSHTLVVTAEDNNGNVSEKTFDFIIEAPTGALLAIENMTKVPGTDRGFPADDYYTFHRLGDPGQALVHDSNVMRLNNSGTNDLIVTDAILSDTNDYSFEVFDSSGATMDFPVTIPAGSFADLDITFIGTTGNGNNGIFVEDIEIVSNADNALENLAVLHGAYSPQPEGGDEINAQEVFDAFGFQSSMLSIVNDEGTITPPNDIRFRPSSNFPLAENIDAGYEGDMILSSNFVQADPSKPVIGIQLSALHGGPGSNGAKFVQVDGTGTVGGINFSHDGAYYQTLLPKTGANINFDTANTISEPFRIAVANYLSSGGNNINGNRPDLLGLRIYKVIDHNGNIIPNEYIVLQDFVQGGCGAGSANCDWNDNTFYFINIRPEGVPTAQPAEAYLANVEEELSLDISQYFDKGYPGNTLTVSASVANGALPAWLSYNAFDGTLSGTPPAGTTGTIEVDFEAVDPNGLTASTTLTININEPPVAVGEEVTTSQNVAILLDQLLANDSEPNGQDFNILTVDTPQNGTAELQADGVSILYTPNTDYVGPDSFIYTIEDETGLTATATVTITVTPENQAPTALIVASINEGPAALFVEFTGSGSTDENPGTLQYAWDFGDGIGTSNDPDTSYTFTSAGVFTVSLTVTDNEGLFDVDTTIITVSAPPNTAPSAVADATQSNANPLQFAFDGSGSNDTEGAVSYQWNFGDGSTSTDAITNHTYAVAGTYDVSLTVTDAGDLTDTATLQVVAEEPINNDFALRINAGGPQITHEGETFSADQNFAGGKVYVNTSAMVPPLYQTERSASPPTFAYNIPLDNGTYQLTLHFAEIYHGATGGGTGGTGKRVFDVTLEGNTILNDYDINADVGSQTVVLKTFEVSIDDGTLNMVFDAAGGDGIDQPKLSAITILGIDDPIVECELPEEWTASDIGAVAADGDTCYDDGRFEVSASGADIWGSADEFHFVYQELEGDGEIIAQVLSLDPTNVWAKAGVMMRNDLDANSASAMMIIAPNPQSVGGPGYSFQHRPTKGATMGGGNFTPPALVPGGFPHYVRMVRSGNTFTGYVSETNGNWTQIGTTNIPMGQSIFVGLATTSHSDGNLTNAVYENVEVIETDIPNVTPTAVAEADPENGVAPLEVSFDGTGSSDDTGGITYQWDFDDGSAPDSGAVTQHTFVNSGTYDVVLTVTDIEGETDTDTVTITVIAPNVAPTAVAEATPLNGEAPLQVSFTGSNSTDDGNVSELTYAWNFGNGVTSTEADPVYTFDTPGTYVVTLVVSDAQGLDSQPASVSIEVEEPVVVGDFALRINAGGPAIVHNGESFVADQNFVGGKSYTNASAALPPLYQTERSALPPNFGYEIPLTNGSYQITLHFAELFWGANGGKPGGVGTRIFDVVMEGNTVLNDYDIIADVGSQTVVTKTFDVVVQDGNLSLALDAAGSDGKNEPKLSAIEILSVGAVNDAPTAVASADVTEGEAPLQVSFSSNGSDDDKDIVSFAWDFKDGTTSIAENPQHTFDTPGVYSVSLTVSDAEGETDEATVTITVNEPVVNDFALRINAGGPQVVHNGETFSADTNFAGGKVYVNNNATVPTLYKTERSALPPTFAYNVPVDNGSYQVVLHFAEIYWGATGGGAGGTGKRVFDVAMEGNPILNDYDINADVGPQTVAIKTFNVTVADGVLNLVFDAAGSDGVDQPKLSAIEILGAGANKVDPIVDAGESIEYTLSTNGFTLTGSGSDPDGGAVSFEWTQVSGPDTALFTDSGSPVLNADVLVAGIYDFRLTVTDDEGVQSFDEVTVTATDANGEEVWLEAECADVGTGWSVINDGGVSGEQYLLPPAGFNSSTSSIGNAIVTFNFSVTAGTYKIFGRVRTPSGTEDSFWVRVNGGPWVRWNSIPSSNVFAWHRIHLNEQLSQPRSFEFVDGVNQVEIGHRESGAALDKLYITQTDNIPSNLGGSSTNCGGVAKSFDPDMIADNSGNVNKSLPEGFNAPIANEVSMYPNAADYSTQITMTNPEADITKLYVYDVSGRLIRSYEGLELKTSPGAYLLEVSNLENGVYLLRMVATDGNIFDEKLLVRH